ncbi:MAG TPA: hypothetical protein DCY94_05190 [Firmicutes bacterium]|nr:hypothetical protein [Bacillota bacterium]
MRDILITGGTGKIGFNLVEKLLDTNYSVTIFDLESPNSLKKMSSVKNNVKFVYGDVEDENLVRDLVKRNDFVIDYAGIMPPFANLDEDIANSTNFIGTKNIADAIKEVNPECVYFYMSFISVFGEADKAKRTINVETESTHPDDYYSVSIIRSENYIRDNLEKFVILRMPLVLTRKNYFINHMQLGKRVDCITKDNLNDIVIGILDSKKVLGKTYNISGFKVLTDNLIDGIYRSTGELTILGRSLYYGEYEDAKEIDKVVDIQYSNLEEALSFYKDESSVRLNVIRKSVNFLKYLLFKKMGNSRKKN